MLHAFNKFHYVSLFIYGLQGKRVHLEYVDEI